MRQRSGPRRWARRGSSDRHRKGLDWKQLLLAVVLGSVFSAFGALLLLFDRGLIGNVTSRHGKDPPGPLFGFGAAMLGAGLLIFIGFGLVPLWRYWCRKRRIARHPNESWYADSDWDPSGTVAGYARGTLLQCVYAPFFLLFACPLHWHYPVQAVVLDVVILLPVVVLLAGPLKHGRSLLRFETFPFFLGEKLRARLVLSRPLDRFRNLKIELVCTRESWRTRAFRTYQGHTTMKGIETDELYTDSHTIDEPGKGGVARWELPVEFDLPKLSYETDLGSTPRTSWMLKVTGDVPGLNYKAQFLVPVYARPG